jgi:CRISPR/Cas system CMR-associated protein Cmr5 small subunit
MLTQFDDNIWEFIMAYAKGSNNKMKAKYYSYVRECPVVVSIIFHQCYLYGLYFVKG